MVRATLVLVLVAALLGGAWVAWDRLRVQVEPEPAAQAQAPRIPPLEPPVAERLARIDARLRLTPDRRALAAIGELHRLVHGGNAGEVEVAYASGSWRITRDGQPLAMLSEFPRFSALLSLLDEQAAKELALPGARKLSDPLEIRPELQDRLNHLDDAEALDVLALVDARWRDGTAGVGDLLAATDALAQLCLLMPRDSAAADRLAARAFASLALARQHFADRTLRAEATLAFATGYATHARAVAEGLPRDEPLAAFVRNDLAVLERASRPSDASHVDVLYGTRLLWWRGNDAWVTWYRSLPEKRAQRAVVVAPALDERGTPPPDFAPELYASLLRCGAQSEQTHRDLAGPFADATLFRDLYRSACQYAQRTPAPAAPARTPEEADAIAAPLDSRASARLLAGSLARDAYRDPGLEDRLYGAAVDVYGAEHGWLVQHVASFRHDWLTLWAMVETNAYRFDERLAAVGALEQQKPVESERLRRGYENLFREAPDSEPLRRQFALWLDEELGKHKAARNVLLPLLTAHGASDPESNAVAGLVARLHLADGNAHEAWELIEPRLDQPAVQLQAVRAQIAMGDLARAEAIARATHEQHPTSLPAAAQLGAVLWEARRHDEAARLMAAPFKGASDKERCQSFCRAFVRAFRGEPPAEVEAAFRALVEAKVDPALIRGTLDLLRSGGMPETAFALGNLLTDAPIEIHTATYKSLRHLRGDAEAVPWMAAKVPRERLGDAASVFYFQDADELLWRLSAQPEPEAGATWLFRAAAFAREAEPSAAHRAMLTAYFSAHQHTLDEQLGAALVGLIEPEDLLSRAQNETDLDRVAYFLGARAEGTRDFRGALRMYQLALVSPQRTPGRTLAEEALSRIQSRQSSPDALARERGPRAVVAGR